MMRLKKLKKLFETFKIDGYIIPKNDEFFGEYVAASNDNLKFISNFSGSYGFALILKKKNYLFVDGRYTLQAKIQSKKNFQIVTLPKKFPSDILKNKKLSIGFDPKLHTQLMLNRFFHNSNCKLVSLNENLINKIWIRKKTEKINKFYKLKDKDAGQNSKNKIKTLSRLLNKNKTDMQFVSASENVAWLLNLRGGDCKFAPIPNSYLILDSKNKVFFFCNIKKIDKNINMRLKNIEIIDIKIY